MTTRRTRAHHPIEPEPEPEPEPRPRTSAYYFLIAEVLSNTGRTVRLVTLLIVFFASLTAVVYVTALASPWALLTALGGAMIGGSGALLRARFQRRSYKRVLERSADQAAVIEELHSWVLSQQDLKAETVAAKDSGDFPPIKRPNASTLAPSVAVDVDNKPSAPICSVYCASEKDASLVVAVLDRTLAEFGVVLEEDGPPIIGSWRQWFRLKSKEVTSSKQLQKRLREAEQALVTRLLEGPGAQVTKTLSESVCALLRDSKDVDDIVVHLPRLLFVKQGGVVRARVLSETEALELDANQHILNDPVAAMRYVASLESRSAEDHSASNVVAEIDGLKDTTN